MRVPKTRDPEKRSCIVEKGRQQRPVKVRLPICLAKLRTRQRTFGRQLKMERLARGWSLPELSKRTETGACHLGRIENGKRPSTKHVAAARAEGQITGCG